MLPPQMFVIKLIIKEMHFKNVDHLAHALYKKILNTLHRLKTVHHFIVSCLLVLLSDDNINTAMVAPTLNCDVLHVLPNFRVHMFREQLRRHVYIRLVFFHLN